MRKREREITLLYGMSLIRDDVLNRPLPKQSAKDRLIAFVHYAFAFASVVTLAASTIILILSFIPTTGQQPTEPTMADITQMTDAQKLKLEVYRLVMNDSAATEKAIEFIAGSYLNFELFKDAYAKTANEPTALAKTEKAIREAKEVLDLFTTGV